MRRKWLKIAAIAVAGCCLSFILFDILWYMYWTISDQCEGYVPLIDLGSGEG